MKNKKTILFASLAVILAIILLLSFSTGEMPANKEIIKIGVIIPLTGDVGFLGEGIRDAMVLAKEQLGNTKYEYEIIFEDNSFDTTKTLSAINKLVYVDKIDSVISIGSGQGSIISPITEENNILHISIATDKKVSEGMYNFIHWTTPEEEVRMFLDELESRGIEKVGIVRENSNWASSITVALEEQISKKEVEITLNEVYNKGATDFRTSLMKSKESGAEVLLIIGISPEIEIIGKQINELNIDIPLSAIESFENTEEYELFEGAWYVYSANPTESYVTDFKNKYNSEPLPYSGNGYDCLKLIIKSFEKTENGKASEAKDILQSTKGFVGAMGILNVLPGGIVDSKAIVKQILNGEKVVLI
ncbi:MAG: ABC transporter substrate-binding protein [Nanoarchaeota archaeon]|nr:ABC transporter substrate-binding protein [Nanoarchaeota archaeon]